MKCIMIRKYGIKETQSVFLVMNGIDKYFECVAIELPRVVIPYRPNAHNVDCIPEGIYPVKKIISPTKGKCFLLEDVPDRFAVEIHIGNFVAGKKVDSQGCILPGMSFEDINEDGNIDVADSTKALNKLWDILPDSFKLHIL